MANNVNLRSFNVNQADLEFILRQIEFRPLFALDNSGNLVAVTTGWDGASAIYDQNRTLLFDPSASYTVSQAEAMAKIAYAPYGQIFDKTGKPIVVWNGSDAIYDAHGTEIWAGLGTFSGGVINAALALSIFGPSYGTFNSGSSAVTDFAGLRNVSGLFNNLNPGQSHWGQTDGFFSHVAKPHEGGYLQEIVAGAPTTEFRVTDLTAAMAQHLLTTTTADGPTTTGTVIVNGRTFTYGSFDRTTTSTDAATTTLNGHHMVASMNEVDLTTTSSTTSFDAFSGLPMPGELPVAGPIVSQSSTFLSGGELDAKYHPQFTATNTNPGDPTFDPAHYVSNLKDRAHVADNTDYSITFATPASVATMYSVIDYTPRMITQTITQGGSPVEYLKVADAAAITGDPLDHTWAGTGYAYAYKGGTGVVLLRDGANHVVYWDGAEYRPDLVKLVEADIASGANDAKHYRGLTAGTVLGSDAHGNAITWDAIAYSYSKAIVDHNIVTPGLIQGAAIVDTSVALMTGQADGKGGITGAGDANLYSGAGYGTLSITGQHDKQNTDANSATGYGNHEYFDGNIASIAGNAPNNGWFALFGQFLDHGLDFINKSSTYQIIIPLAVDDPLYGVIGPDGKPTTSITINRAVVQGAAQLIDPVTGQPALDASGKPVLTAAYVNHDSPYIDQSQTYGSQADVDNILRNWVKDPNTGNWEMGDTLVDGHQSKAYSDAFGNTTTDTLPTLNELRAEIRSHGGSDVNGARADLTWEDVSQGLRMRDASGAVIVTGPGAGIVEPLLLDNNPHYDKAHITGEALATINAALNTAGLGSFMLSFDSTGALESAAGVGLAALAPFINFADFSIQSTLFGAPGQYAIGDASTALHQAIGEVMMEAVGDHYIAGDGRANENIGLTAIHHVFHEEHGYQVQNIETYILGIDQENNLVHGKDTSHPHATAHDWQEAVAVTAPATSIYVDGTSGVYQAKAGSVVARDVDGNFYVTGANLTTASEDSAFAGYVTDKDGNPITATGSYTDASGMIAWDQNKMFNAAKMTVEMEYQHIAVDQYSRAVSPNIQEFGGYASDRNADISQEFSQAAFRFGHSTLRETIDTMDPTGGITGKIMSYALEQAFVNPALFSKIGAGAVALGMERQLMNEVDNTITPSLNEGLLGQPLDLGAINIARGRDVGVPTLNEAKTALGMKAYADWADFGAQMIHQDQLVNYIAAYTFDGDMTKAQTIVDLAAGMALGSLSADEQAYATTIGTTYADRVAYASHFLNGGDKGIDKVDLWIGGLAEQHVAGGVLGETFDTIFVTQIENLMDGDRFYYLQRLVNQQFGNEIQNEQFKDLVERTTGNTNMNGNIFAYADQYYDEGRAAKVATADLTDPTKMGDLYAGSKADGSWHEVFKVGADGHSGTWLDAMGVATTTKPAGAIYDLWGQEVTDLYAQDGHLVFSRSTMTWTDASYDPTVSPANAGKALYVDHNTNLTTGISIPTDPNFALMALGADQHKYQQIVDLHASEANTTAGVDGVSDTGATVVDESSNVGVGIWSVGGGSTIANGQIQEHAYQLTLNDGTDAYGNSPALLQPAGAIGGVDPSVNPTNHMSVDERYILDVRPDGTTHNGDGSIDSGASSAEVLVGTKFNDYIELGVGDDTAYGGAGNDVIFGGKSNAGHNSIYGGDGNDFLFGGDAPDLIDGGKGDDWIWGNSSGASVGGMDQLIGGDGNDHIFGGIGIDKLFGGTGDDFMYGGQDTDPTFFGGDGNDYMSGGTGSDFMNGDAGDDIMDGGPGVDQLFGGAGDDILRPGPGVASVGGNGGGADVLIGGESGTKPDGSSSDAGFDFADYSQQTIATGIVGDLANQALVSQLPKDKTPLPAGVIAAASNGDVWFEMEGIIGSKNADILRGDSPTDVSATVSHGDNWLIGGSGNDLLQGRGGNDLIVGGSVRLDTLIGTYKDGGANGTQDPYTSYVDGASHRVSASAVLSGGLLDYASVNGVSGVTYADHLTDLLKSGAYKNYFLGDGSPTGGNDTAAFSGAQTDYQVTYLPFVDAHGTKIAAFQVKDTRPGSPDGTDLLVGIQTLAFNYNETTNTGTMVRIVDALDAAPTFFTAALAGPAYAEGTSNAVGASQNGLTPAGTLIGTLMATDALTAGQLALGATQGPLTWSIADTNQAINDLFTITPTLSALGAVSVAAATLSFAKSPDFEALKVIPGATVNAQGQLALTVHVQVSDGLLSAVQTETVLIGNVDEKPSGNIHFAGATVSNNNASAVLQGSVGTFVDPDVTGPMTMTFGLASHPSLTVDATSAIQQFLLTGTYAQPFPLPNGQATSIEVAFVGTTGNDKIAGTSGADLLIGLRGNDTYVVNNPGDVVVEGFGGGTDTVLAALGSYTLTANVENLTHAGANGTLLGTDFVGTGNTLANIVTGGTGNNTFVATVDNARDQYIGNADSNHSDTVDYSAYGAALTVDFSSVNGGAVTVGGSGTNQNTDLLYGIENFIGGTGNDTIIAARDNVANAFDGGGGSNTADYSAYRVGLTVDFNQTKVAVAGSGADAAHSDTLTNIQTFIGGSGGDTVVAKSDGVQHAFDGGLGNDTIDFSSFTSGLSIDLRGSSANTMGFATVVGSGPDAAHSDLIKSFEHVVGGSGGDTVIIGSGTTNFTGHAGNDTMVFAPGSWKTGANRDLFSDFTIHAGTSTGDQVDLTGLGAVSVGHQGAAFFWNGHDAEFAAGRNSVAEIRYHSETVNGVVHTILDYHTAQSTVQVNGQVDLGAGGKVLVATDLTVPIANQHPDIIHV